MVTFEYKIQETYLYHDEAALNELGAQGWRLCLLMANEYPVRYVFCRELEPGESVEDLVIET
jgi:hypothetical protein